MEKGNGKQVTSNYLDFSIDTQKFLTTQERGPQGLLKYAVTMT